MARWVNRRCDSCGSQLDSNGMCHANPECCNYSPEYPQCDDEFDKQRDKQLNQTERIKHENG